MSSTQNYKDYILEQLSLLDNITYRPMMGEFLLYYNGTLFGGIYDNKLLIKKVDSNKKYNMEESIPYENSKAMYLVNEDGNKELIREIVLETCKALKSQSKN